MPLSIATLRLYLWWYAVHSYAPTIIVLMVFTTQPLFYYTVFKLHHALYKTILKRFFNGQPRIA